MSSPYYRFDGVNDVITVTEATQTPHLELGTGDFSFEMLVKAEEWTSLNYIFGKFEDGNNYYALNTDSNDFLNFYAIDGGSAKINLVATATGGLTDGQWAHIAVVADRSGSGQFYVNGTAIGTTTSVMSTDAVEQNADFTFARLDTNYGEMEMSNLKYFNKALTATEVKEMYSGMSVPFKYKGANQTNLITGWTNSGAYGFANFGSSGADLTQFDGDGTLAYAYTNTVPFVVGAKYRLTVVLDNTSGSLPNLMIAEVNGANSISGTDGSFNFAGTELADGTNTFEFTATSAFTTSKRVVLQENATSVNNSATFELVRIGAVAEYDGSGIASDKWFDKSGNDLHGTVSGATVENAPSDSSGLVYEEGTWTPAFSTSGHAPSSITVTRAVYTRIGDVVTLEGNIGFDDSGGGGDPFTLENVPFNFATNSFPTGVANFRFTAFS
jgi:hypothetical protein